MSPRGGRREGQIGQSYQNRTDLNAQKPVAQAAYSGGEYGNRQQLLQNQQAVPVAPAPGAPSPGQGAAPTATTSAPATPQGPLPGSFGLLHRPTERPDEPITHGLATGPGAGPEVLGLNQSTVGDLLKQLASQPYASGEVQMLMQAANRGR
jgi:hypothetical protein